MAAEPGQRAVDLHPAPAVNITDVRRLASPAVNNLIIDHTAATRPEYTDAMRSVLYPSRRPEPMNIDLCSSCEHGAHQLCPCRLGAHGYRPVFDCKCLCRYADHGLPARPSPAVPA